MSTCASCEPLEATFNAPWDVQPTSVEQVPFRKPHRATGRQPGTRGSQNRLVHGKRAKEPHRPQA
jgi:hypothetical protein